jgi:hypothetical protein
MDRRLTQQDSVRVHPEQAEALGWTAKHLFGLHKPPNSAASELQSAIPIRRDRSDLAAWRPRARRAHRGDGSDPEFDWRHHDLPQAQQAGARPARRQPRRS